MKSPTFTIIVGVMIGLAVIGTMVSAVAVYRSTKKGPGGPKGSGGAEVSEKPRVQPA